MASQRSFVRFEANDIVFLRWVLALAFWYGGMCAAYFGIAFLAMESVDGALKVFPWIAAASLFVTSVVSHARLKKVEAARVG